MSFDAYAAGFFDGEGCIVVSVSTGKSRGYGYQTWMSLIVSVHQLDQRPLMALQAAYGGSIVRGKGSGEWRKSKAATYKWRLHNMDALDFLAKIRPHLILKAEEADLALKWRKFTGVKSRGMPPEMKAERMAIRDGLMKIRADRKADAEEAHQRMIN